jgi:hypothetical protein
LQGAIDRLCQLFLLKFHLTHWVALLFSCEPASTLSLQQF